MYILPAFWEGRPAHLKKLGREAMEVIPLGDTRRYPVNCKEMHNPGLDMKFRHLFNFKSFLKKSLI